MKKENKGTIIIDKIKNLDNKLLQAQILAYLINNKKVSKILKSKYIKYFTELFEELPSYYHNYQYSIDMKTYFNSEESTNNVIPNFVSTTNYIDYSVVLNYTVKNKHLVDTILESYNITLNETNFKNMKKVLSGKFNEFEFKTMDENNVIVTTEELSGKDITQKSFKENLNFTLPNSIVGFEVQAYPLVFTYISTDKSTINFNIFSEEDILTTQHYTIPKLKINKYLQSR
jgi:predicted double-glycine peptidase